MNVVRRKIMGEREVEELWECVNVVRIQMLVTGHFGSKDLSAPK